MCQLKVQFRTAKSRTTRVLNLIAGKGVGPSAVRGASYQLRSCSRYHGIFPECFPACSCVTFVSRRGSVPPSPAKHDFRMRPPELCPCTARVPEGFVHAPLFSSLLWRTVLVAKETAAEQSRPTLVCLELTSTLPGCDQNAACPLGAHLRRWTYVRGSICRG